MSISYAIYYTGQEVKLIFCAQGEAESVYLAIITIISVLQYYRTLIIHTKIKGVIF